MIYCRLNNFVRKTNLIDSGVIKKRKRVKEKTSCHEKRRYQRGAV